MSHTVSISVSQFADFHGSGEGLGEAPIRTVLRLAVKLAVEDKDLWEPRGRYMSVLFHHSRRSVPSRQSRLRACGFLALLHMVALHTGPDPISPFLLRASYEERAYALRADVPFLQILSPEASTALAPWVNLDVSTPLDIGSNSAVGRLLYGANINVSRIVYQFSVYMFYCSYALLYSAMQSRSIATTFSGRPQRD